MTSNQPRFSKIKEKIYPYGGKTDFDEHIKYILSLDDATVKRDQQRLLNTSHNVYLFCKDSAERYLERHRGNLRLIINRPSVIISSCKEPFPGWCDSIAAAGAFAFPAALGIVQNFYLPNSPIDYIPVDICSNQILVTP